MTLPDLLSDPYLSPVLALARLWLPIVGALVLAWRLREENRRK